MKLLFFTPILLNSAIARVSKIIIEQLLLEGHQVLIVRSEDPSCFHLPTYDYSVDIKNWNEFESIISIINSVDIIIYQIGDNFQLHQGCLEWLPRFSGIVCLHDYFLGHLFCAWSLEHKLESQAVLEHWYEKKMVNNFFNHNSSESFIEFAHIHAPMTEWKSSMALGVVTHSEWGIQRVLNSCPGPIEILSLPYDRLQISLKLEKKKNEKFTILTMGHINWNKRAESVIKALAGFPEVRNAVYQLVGAIEPHISQHLTMLAQELKVELIISGVVSNDFLAAAIEQADVICCLRFPALEAASASTIEAMLHNKPVVVINTGFYQELPDDCVFKISIENEILELKKTLEYIYENPRQKEEVGLRAGKWSKETFCPEKYAKEIVNFCRCVLKEKPIIEASQIFSNYLFEWDDQIKTTWMEYITKPLKIFEHA